MRPLCRRPLEALITFYFVNVIEFRRQFPEIFTLACGATRTVFSAATYRSTKSQTGGPSVPSLTLAQPVTTYSFFGSIGLPDFSWVIAEMRRPIGLTMLI